MSSGTRSKRAHEREIAAQSLPPSTSSEDQHALKLPSFSNDPTSDQKQAFVRWCCGQKAPLPQFSKKYLNQLRRDDLRKICQNLQVKVYLFLFIFSDLLSSSHWPSERRSMWCANWASSQGCLILVAYFLWLNRMSPTRVHLKEERRSMNSLLTTHMVFMRSPLRTDFLPFSRQIGILSSVCHSILILRESYYFQLLVSFVPPLFRIYFILAHE